MNQAEHLLLRQELIGDEGCCRYPYVDSLGNITIGVGYNLSNRGMSEVWINTQLNDDIEYFLKQLNTFPWFADLSNARQRALVSMAFMGWQKFIGFKNMLAALAEKDYQKAADELLNSNYAKQVPNRAKRLADKIKLGD